MRPFLQSAWLKVERANRHLRALNESIAQYSQSQFNRVGVYFHRETGEKIFRLDRPLDEPPPQFSPIIGDVLFGYRSALDHLMRELVIISGSCPTDGTQFPICDTRERFHGRGERMWRGVTPAIQATLEREQPYCGHNNFGGELLVTLRDLNNIDKHRHFNLVVSIYQGTLPEDLSQIDINTLRGFTDKIIINAGRIEAGAELARIPRDYVHVDFSPSFSIAFAESGWPTEEISISHVLGGIADHVTYILDEYEQDFIRPFYTSKV